MENYKKTSSLKWETGKVKGFKGKELIDMSKGGLKLVKVNPFATYPSHIHPDKTEYAYVLEGSPKMTIGETIYTGEKGDFFIFPKSIKHSIDNPHAIECTLLVGAIKD